ncbi:hypothetical protein [Streptomyces sp. CC219B]|uniref:hypothetical protein n=1 Tax=Streptomyces sp. CC219B TaxID=3044574 RepID=UPI0024A9664D|nr:hypothetical protein [Streptomyces sp. CC219B]
MEFAVCGHTPAEGNQNCAPSTDRSTPPVERDEDDSWLADPGDVALADEVTDQASRT